MAILEIFMPVHSLRCKVCNWSGINTVPASCPQCFAPFDAVVIQAGNGSWLFAHKPGNGISIRARFSVSANGKKAPRSWYDRGVEVNNAN